MTVKTESVFVEKKVYSFPNEDYQRVIELINQSRETIISIETLREARSGTYINTTEITVIR